MNSKFCYVTACSTNPKYDITCHGSCPNNEASDWTKNKLFYNCTLPKTYHCAVNNKTPLEGCVVPIECNEGKFLFQYYFFIDIHLKNKKYHNH